MTGALYQSKQENNHPQLSHRMDSATLSVGTGSEC